MNPCWFKQHLNNQVKISHILIHIKIPSFIIHQSELQWYWIKFVVCTTKNYLHPKKCYKKNNPNQIIFLISDKSTANRIRTNQSYLKEKDDEFREKMKILFSMFRQIGGGGTNGFKEIRPLDLLPPPSPSLCII